MLVVFGIFTWYVSLPQALGRLVMGRMIAGYFSGSKIVFASCMWSI